MPISTAFLKPSPAPRDSDAFFTTTVLDLLAELETKGYTHLCPTPETQWWALSKRQALSGSSTMFSKSVQDIWGWSLPVRKEVLYAMHSKPLVDALLAVKILTPEKSDQTIVSPRIRVSSLFPFAKAPNYYIHSSWPTKSRDSVFFGPESYRFTRYMASLAGRITNCKLAIDVCSGAGVGAFQLALSYPSARIIGLDINEKAIQLAKVNTLHLFPLRAAAAPIDMLVSDGFAAVIDDPDVLGKVDVVSINPPFIAGDKRTYASGGPTGMELILRMISEAKDVLRVGGELYGHMAAPCCFDGRDRFKEAIQALDGWELAAYEILDVDIFGEEVGSPENYPDIARLASVGLVLKKISC